MKVDRMKDRHPPAGAFSTLDTALLAWSAGYWRGKEKTCKKREDRKRWKSWADEAFAELLARKLAE